MKRKIIVKVEGLVLRSSLSRKKALEEKLSQAGQSKEKWFNCKCGTHLRSVFFFILLLLIHQQLGTRMSGFSIALKICILLGNLFICWKN